ncbi:MAG: deoxyhypusine synthase [Deltaproteobacteria bacterium GWA2_38_16]|nr:MAG: deoxyhypusine synthase [Deltaproteobacteria bacterium GWA2_38_16]OGQ03447.1 MAG: deoxyhypusine synthase [Deltaproteobacteria bacterium RIFCSPHIGHO2_02_FULL_38_15]OGQ34734.1 MAG: deoxyhypusine synthase [Deltaproteobacteria bacterium RIFCSPLOWO2_01_FULL_38_9]HBQ20679.1 deoxyhypusine synthase [Deltaproteobacteria bacterium]
MTIKDYIKHHFRHFNAAVVIDAAEAYCDYLTKGNKMMITLAGAMSTAELGLSLAEMIRQEKVHAICCTGANLEEDVFNLVAHEHYKRVSQYRNLTAKEEVDLYKQGMNRVTDTCIPEEEAMRRIEKQVLKLWQKADQEKKRYFPYEFLYQLIKNGAIKDHYQIDPKNSWMIAACEKNLPIFTPGWEDSTLGNIFVSNVIKKNISNYQVVKSGLEQMASLIEWYQENSQKSSIGFFQIGGGIAGDFPICVVPLITQDLKQNCKLWGYFCQISDSTTSYGSYSGAVPNEKITWGKLDGKTPRFIIESDATIVAPLMFAYILGQ